MKSFKSFLTMESFLVMESFIVTITALMLTFTYGEVVLLVLAIFTKTAPVDTARYSLPILYLAGTGCILAMATPQWRKAAFWGAIALCTAITLQSVLFLAVKYSLKSVEFWVKLPKFPLFLAIFLLLQYRRVIKEGKPDNHHLLYFIGSFLVTNGALGSLYVYPNYNWTSLITVLVGIGFIARERILGGIGSLILLTMAGIKALALSGYPLLAFSPVILLRAVQFWLVMTILEPALRGASAASSSSTGSSYSSSSYSLDSKSCGRCGKSVGLNYKVGDRCPHCGAYWGASRSIWR